MKYKNSQNDELINVPKKNLKIKLKSYLREVFKTQSFFMIILFRLENIRL